MREYARRNDVSRGTLGYWSSRLNAESRAAGALVEVTPGSTRPSGSSVAERPVELLVGGRFVLRVWSGTPEGHLGMVLSVLGRQT